MIKRYFFHKQSSAQEVSLSLARSSHSLPQTMIILRFSFTTKIYLCYNISVRENTERCPSGRRCLTRNQLPTPLKYVFFETRQSVDIIDCVKIFTWFFCTLFSGVLRAQCGLREILGMPRYGVIAWFWAVPGGHLTYSRRVGCVRWMRIFPTCLLQLPVFRRV